LEVRADSIVAKSVLSTIVNKIWFIWFFFSWAMSLHQTKKLIAVALRAPMDISPTILDQGITGPRSPMRLGIGEAVDDAPCGITPA